MTLLLERVRETTALSITPAPLEALPLVAGLARRIWPVCYAGILTPEQIGNMLEVIYSDVGLRRQAEDGQRFWIAAKGGKPVGFASGYREDETIWLKKLYVEPEQQGQGVATCLMRAVETAFQPASELRLLVNRDNLPAQEFYRRAGFALEGEMPVTMGDYSFTDLVFCRPAMREH